MFEAPKAEIIKLAAAVSTSPTEEDGMEFFGEGCVS